MKEEYYTPTIEEFHVGFEVMFQNIENSQWGSYIITENDNITAMYRENLAWMRVKYLDRDDIESLGWEHDQTTKDGAYFYIGTIMDDNQWCLTAENAILRKGGDYTSLTISEINHASQKCFFGTVKNKSELRRLMTMLNINIKK